MLSGIIPACFHNVGLGADEQAVQCSSSLLVVGLGL